MNHRTSQLRNPLRMEPRSKRTKESIRKWCHMGKSTCETTHNLPKKYLDITFLRILNYYMNSLTSILACIQTNMLTCFEKSINLHCCIFSGIWADISSDKFWLFSGSFSGIDIIPDINPDVSSDIYPDRLS